MAREAALAMFSMSSAVHGVHTEEHLPTGSCASGKRGHFHAMVGERRGLPVLLGRATAIPSWPSMARSRDTERARTAFPC
jgi:hypothetical protein